MRAKVVKNKVAPPFLQAEFDIVFGQGVSRSGDILDLGVEKNIIDKSGTWFSYKGERIGQGRENAKIYLMDNPKLLDEMEVKVLAAHKAQIEALSVKAKPKVSEKAKVNESAVVGEVVSELK